MRWKSWISLILVAFMSFPGTATAPPPQQNEKKAVWNARVTYTGEGELHRGSSSLKYGSSISANYQIASDGAPFNAMVQFEESGNFKWINELGHVSYMTWDVGDNVTFKSTEELASLTLHVAARTFEEVLPGVNVPRGDVRLEGTRRLTGGGYLRGVALPTIGVQTIGNRRYVTGESAIAFGVDAFYPDGMSVNPYPWANTPREQLVELKKKVGKNCSHPRADPESCKEAWKNIAQQEYELNLAGPLYHKQAEREVAQKKAGRRDLWVEISVSAVDEAKEEQERRVELTEEQEEAQARAKFKEMIEKARQGKGKEAEKSAEEWSIEMTKQAGMKELKGNVVHGSRTWTENKYGIEVKHTLSWTFSLVPEELKADPGGPYSPVRAQRLTLDGSRSRGKNLTYKWTFKPTGCPQGLTGNKDASKEGVRPTVVLLCDTDVTLTVNDGKNINRKTVPVAVTARAWKTQVAPQIDAYLTAVKLCLPQPHFGRGVCALDGAAAFEGEQESGHIFHKKPKQITWEDTGYKLDRVDDSNGPFDGWWYVAKTHLKIKRAALINTYLNKNSDLYEENKKRGYRKDFDTLIDQVTAHERMHGTLMGEALPKHEPAKKIELMMDPKDKDTLKQKVDLKIQEADDALWEATKDVNVKERLKKMGFDRPGKVLLPLCNTDPPSYKVFSIPSFATLGD